MDRGGEQLHVASVKAVHNVHEKLCFWQNSRELFLQFVGLHLKNGATLGKNMTNFPYVVYFSALSAT